VKNSSYDFSASVSKAVSAVANLNFSRVLIIKEGNQKRKISRTFYRKKAEEAGKITYFKFTLKGGD